MFQNPGVIAMNTRQYNNLYYAIPRTSFSRTSVYCMIPYIWNELPNELKSLQQRSMFKKQMKQNYISGYADYVACNNRLCGECHRQ